MHPEPQKVYYSAILFLNKVGTLQQIPVERSFIKPKLFFHVFKSLSLNMCYVFFAATEWKGPTAGLKPRSPQNFLPSHLAWSTMCVCVGVGIRICEGTLMPLHSFGGLRKDFRISWLSIRGQWAGL